MNLAVVTTGRFQYGGASFFYERFGSPEAPLAVLMHGILLDSGINRGIARKLVAEGYQVVLLDLFGHGKSQRSADPKDHRADFYAEHCIALLDHLGAERALIGGVSLGCIVALHVAVKAPERVSALWLEMPVMEWSAPYAAVLLAPLLFSARFLAPVQAAFAGLLRRLPRPRGELAASVLDAASMEPAHMAAILHGVLVGAIVPSEAARRAIRVPTLILGHSGDRLHEFRDAWVLHQEIEGSVLLEARHLLELRTRPDRLWPEIRRWLKCLPASESAAASSGPGATPRPPRRKRRA